MPANPVTELSPSTVAVAGHGALDGAAPDIRLYDNLSDVEHAWIAFERAADRTVFQTFEFCSIWLATVGRALGATPLIVVARDGAGTIVMLLPLCRYDGGAVRKIGVVGGLEADYQAPVIAGDFERRYDVAARRALVGRVLAALPDHDALEFERLPEFVGAQRNPLCLLEPDRHFEDAFYAEIAGTKDEFMRERCGSKTLQILRRKRRKLEADGPLRFVIAETREQVDDLLETLFSLKSAQYRATGSADILEKPGRREFYTAFARAGVAGGHSQLSALYSGDEVVAAHWGLIGQGRFHYLLPAHVAGERGKYSPGEALLVDLIGWCVDHEVRQFDFTTGDESYKLRWSQHRLAQFSLIVPRTLRGRLYRYAARTSRRARLAARGTPWLWKLVTIARRRRLIN